MVAFLAVIGLLLLLWTSLLYRRLRLPGGGFFFLMPKSFAASLSPWIGLLGVVGVVLGLRYHQVLIAVLYGLLAIAAAIPAIRIMRTPDRLADAFGPLPRPDMGPSGRRHRLHRSWGVRLNSVPAPRWQRDIPFWSPPDSARALLCDIWQPPAGIAVSGLAFIYFHGSGWTILDKDFHTRPFFRHLAAQGHVVMDVAYRLYPETDIPGMVDDVRRSIAWLKAHSRTYGINPERIVVGGGSAGAHLALLAAYTEGKPDLTPSDVRGIDTSVRGVVSYYGPVDLAACYRYDEVDALAAKMPNPPAGYAPLPPFMRKLMGPDADRLGFQKAAGSGRLDWMLGGSPEQVPERYALLSPAAHLHAGCPPTLFIQGQQDLIVPVETTRETYAKLHKLGVKAANLVLPHTDHAFDLFASTWSPAARVALYHVERFLELMAE